MSLEERAKTTEDLNNHFFVEARDMSVHKRFGDGSLTLITPVANLHYDFLTPTQQLERYVGEQAKNHKLFQQYLDDLLCSVYAELNVLVTREQTIQHLQNTVGGSIAHASCTARSDIFSLFGRRTMSEQYDRAIMLEESNVYGCEELLETLKAGKECLDHITRRYEFADKNALVEWQEAHKDLMFFSNQLLQVAHKKLACAVHEKKFFVPEKPYVLLA